MDESNKDYLKGAIESLFFVSDKPVTLEQFQEALETIPPGDIKALIQELKDDYDKGLRGMVIAEIAGGYQMLSSPEYAVFIRNFFKTRVKEKLSRPALETLAIIAYKQPMARSDIEMIRGVNSDGVVLHLLDKGLIKIVGRKDVPGRPYLYGTAKLFLEYFGLKSLKDLPKLEDFPALQPGVETPGTVNPAPDAGTAPRDLESVPDAPASPAEESGQPDTGSPESIEAAEARAASQAGFQDPAEPAEPENAMDLKRVMEEMSESQPEADSATDSPAAGGRVDEPREVSAEEKTMES
ncbi:MAG: SMC-Scp complex subunit ScpB [Candidatus Omnitrophota bacterium]|nr:SMC-Scp complex subunit ScpB [Candidatus Omnitrophota bacterium]MDZ4242814.1 SMC-Scp complex subunit ScpB [Candidatus Omnitrophota bacterium]